MVVRYWLRIPLQQLTNWYRLWRLWQLRRLPELPIGKHNCHADAFAHPHGLRLLRQLRQLQACRGRGRGIGRRGDAACTHEEMNTFLMGLINVLPGLVFSACLFSENA
jgi:hypothetical protein